MPGEGDGPGSGPRSRSDDHAAWEKLLRNLDELTSSPEWNDWADAPVRGSHWARVIATEHAVLVELNDHVREDNAAPPAATPVGRLSRDVRRLAGRLSEVSSEGQRTILEDLGSRLAKELREVRHFVSLGEPMVYSKAAAAADLDFARASQIDQTEVREESFATYTDAMEVRAKAEVASARGWLIVTVLLLLLLVAGTVALWVAGVGSFGDADDNTEAISRAILAVTVGSKASWTGRQYSSHRQLEVAYRGTAVRMETLRGITQGAAGEDRAMFNQVVAKMLESPIGSVVDKGGPGMAEHIQINLLKPEA